MTTRYLILHLTDSTGTSLPGEEDRRLLERWATDGDAAGRLLDGGPVGPAAQSCAVTVRGGETRIEPSAVPGSSERVVGFDVITAASLDEAAQYMAGHPTAIQGRILVLPIVRLPWETE
ncbi:hypothetical protein Bequi_07850 [Brachybacterium sp. JHP9]|uniref:YCII-related domain-containing protein n=1 Tax=Brachybacterium equifaecis TaxID=2910770 RepID=A0ABT0R056_9MICO|nr:hypothetical protein [Brachybacterium equifaecis]MCL6423298.1 hypothetical protein [Brachybacterium equifaecis]